MFTVRKRNVLSFFFWILLVFTLTFFQAHAKIPFLDDFPKKKLQEMIRNAYIHGYDQIPKKKTCPNLSSSQPIDENILNLYQDIHLLLNNLDLQNPTGVKKMTGLPRSTASLSLKVLPQIDKLANVLYFTPPLRQLFEVTVKDGKLIWRYPYDLRGEVQPLDIRDKASYVFRDGKLYVMPHEDFEKYITDALEPEISHLSFRHSSFFAGENVEMTGELQMEKGNISRIDNFSGHYKPAHTLMPKFVHQLKKLGLRLDDSQVRGFDPTEIQLMQFFLNKKDLENFRAANPNITIDEASDHDLMQVQEWAHRHQVDSSKAIPTMIQGGSSDK